MRHVILHHHIFKNAGSSLDFALSRQFGDAFCELHHETGVLSLGFILDFLVGNPAIRALSSHHSHGCCLREEAEARGIRILNMIFIRDPIERTASIYQYYRRVDGPGLFEDAAKELSYSGFVSFLIADHPYMIDNPQANQIANGGFYARPPAEHDLNRAQTRIQDFAMAAPVERFDDAMASFEYFAAPALKPTNLNLAYRRQNVSQHESRGLIASLPMVTRRWLTERSRLDARLHRFAEEELRRRIAATPDFTVRLSDFRARCAILP